jgi:hypothetical protein
MESRQIPEYVKTKFPSFHGIMNDLSSLKFLQSTEIFLLMAIKKGNILWLPFSQPLDMNSDVP